MLSVMAISTYLAPAHVAAILGVSRSTVLRLVRTGQLPCIRVGPRTIRVSVEELERFLATRSTPSQRASAKSGHTGVQSDDPTGLQIRHEPGKRAR